MLFRRTCKLVDFENSKKALEKAKPKNRDYVSMQLSKLIFSRVKLLIAMFSLVQTILPGPFTRLAINKSIGPPLYPPQYLLCPIYMLQKNLADHVILGSIHLPHPEAQATS